VKNRIRIRTNLKRIQQHWIQNTALITVHTVWSVWCIPGQVVEEAPILVEVGDQPQLGDDSLVLVVCRNKAENILMPAKLQDITLIYIVLFLLMDPEPDSGRSKNTDSETDPQ
jgi:hypothetical protein